MGSGNADELTMFSREWYDEFFRRAASSEAHSQFCEMVYGRDLCQHGLMHMRELDFLVSLIEPHSSILEVGCSNGFITEYIHDRTDSTILGLDFSDVAVEQASRRTRNKAQTLRFEHADLTKDVISGTGYDYIILIDSIYFLGDYTTSLNRFNERLSARGKMVTSVFQGKGEEHPAEILSPDGTLLARALRELGFEYAWYDFTADMIAHGMDGGHALEELREAFEAEGNEFLYEARAEEIRHFRELAEREEITRYMYVVGSSRSTCPLIAAVTATPVPD